MVAACRDALHEAGLLFNREGWEIDPTVEPPYLVSYFVLEYPETGERREYDKARWPIVPNPKRAYAVDKALAGALTTSVGYFMRDLLNVPRADRNEMDRREDVDQEPPQTKPSDASKTLQAEIAAQVGLLKDKRHVKTAGTYLDRAGHDLKLLRQVKGWLDRRIAEQASTPADTPAASPQGVDRETGEVLDDDTPDEPSVELDPESPQFGLGRGEDGP